MADTTFTDNVTHIVASWLNDANGATYKGTAVYPPAGAGAVPTTMKAKFGEYISVKDFGATGNGSTDDSAAIRLAATAATGKMLVFPPGTYKVVDGFTLTGDYATLYGYGATIVYSCATGYVWVNPGDHSLGQVNYNHCIIMNGNYQSVLGITVRCAGTVLRGQTGFALTAGNATPGAQTFGLTVQDCLFVNIGSSATWFSNCADIKVTNNTIDSCLADGIHFTDGCFGIVCTNNIVRFCEDDHIAVVNDVVESGAPVLVGNCVVSNNVILGQAGLWGDGIDLIGVQVGVISNNVISGLVGAGIQVGWVAADPDPTHGDNYLIIQGNNISDCGKVTSPKASYNGTGSSAHPGQLYSGMGINAQQAEKVVFIGNTIHNLAYSGSYPGGGISIASSTELTIQSNNFYDIGPDCIYVGSATTACTVVDNTFGYCFQHTINIQDAAGTAIPSAIVKNNTFYISGTINDLNIYLPNSTLYLEYSGHNASNSVTSTTWSRAVKARFQAYGGGGQSFPGGVGYYVLDTPNGVFDDTSSFTYSGAGTSKFTTPNTGYYVFSGGVFFNFSVCTGIGLAIFVNGSLNKVINFVANGGALTSWQSGVFTGTSPVIALNKGDVVTFQAYTSAAATNTGGSPYIYFSGYQL